MDNDIVISKLEEAINQSKGDDGRNQYLIKRLKKNKKIINSDRLYLEKILNIDISKIDYNETIQKPVKKDKTIFLNPNMIKCNSCKNEIKLEEKSSRYNNNWYHELCVKPILDKNNQKIIEVEEEIPKRKPDIVQVTYTVAIIVFLVTSVYFILGPLSMIAMGIGGVITLYHVVGATGKLYATNKPGKRAPSIFLVFLLGSPFIIGTMIAFEGYTLLESPVRIILLWALTISFWSTMLFVPMAVVSKYREDTQKPVKTFPKISVVIPAYNEEKVIANTIEGLLETKYPNKE
ncbi:MAG: glycosyl transferase, partial [Nitrosopumilus sp.]|nr:glycosyl transferase [Nitrosopumilus sp.]NNL37429.1 glycosyl transferase [Nitrosopumilus sp.]